MNVETSLNKADPFEPELDEIDRPMVPSGDRKPHRIEPQVINPSSRDDDEDDLYGWSFDSRHDEAIGLSAHAFELAVNRACATFAKQVLYTDGPQREKALSTAKNAIQNAQKFIHELLSKNS